MKYLHEIVDKKEKKYLVMALAFHIILFSLIFLKNSSTNELENNVPPESSLSDNGEIGDNNTTIDQELLEINNEKEIEKLNEKKLNANAVSSKDVDSAIKSFNDEIKKEEERIKKIENDKIEAIKREQKEKEDKLAKEKADKLAKEKADKLAKEKADKLAKEKADKENKERLEKIRKNEEDKRKKSIEAMKRASLDKQKADQERRMSNQNRGYDSKTKSLSKSEKMAILKVYRDQVYNKVYGNWIRPSYSKKGWSCKAIVNQSRTGKVNSVKIINCQGDSNFQESVKRAIYKSSPLPLPKDNSLFNDTIEITFKVT